MNGILPLPLGVVILAVLISAATDVWKFKVLNILTLPLMASGLLYHSLTHGALGFTWSLLGALCGLGLLLPLYILGGMGAGDVKLMAAIGAWLGLPLTLYVFIASSLAAGIYSLIVICWYRRTEETWINLKIAWHRISTLTRHLGSEERIESEVVRQDRRGRIIPFAAMIALGVLGALAWTKYWENY
ncbi:MAG: prepilin peptidase [Gemmataceae bacterium]